MYYLNTDMPMLLFQNIINSNIYVDKSRLIEKISAQMSKGSQYICITRPRRFGKTVNANMLGAYYTKGTDSSFLFDGLAVSKQDNYRKHLNSHNVIYIDFSRMPDFCDSYRQYIGSIVKKLYQDLKEAYPSLQEKEYDSISEMLRDTKERFVFILDEWDCVFYQTFASAKDKNSYLMFLKGMFKDQPYAELVYMTGVLPIAKYSSGSELNMFKEYNFMNDCVYEEYFGLSEKEVLTLCENCGSVKYEELKFWYDGYFLSSGESLFNPRSVNCALTDGICMNYWTQTGPMNEIAECIEHNAGQVREDIVKLVSGISVEVQLNGYSAVQQQLNSRDEILSAMVVYGFLSYHNGKLKIPNHELMEKFQEVLLRDSMGEVREIVKDSKKMLEATLACDEKKVAQMLERVHDREIPFLQYNDENSLSCVITLCYLYARNDYRIEREEKSGKGYCDYLFYPKKSGKPAIILELKADCSAMEAVRQIKHKNYLQKVEKYERVLLAGISYAKKEKKHDCVIEEWQNPAVKDNGHEQISETVKDNGYEQVSEIAKDDGYVQVSEMEKTYSDRRKSFSGYAVRLSEMEDAFSPGPVLPEKMDALYCDTMEVRMGDKYNSPAEDIYKICRQTHGLRAVLFTGHRGCGKTTELNRIAKKLEEEGYPVKTVMCSMDLAFFPLNPADFFLLAGEILLEMACAAGCMLKEDILHEIAAFWDGKQIAEAKADLKCSIEKQREYQQKIMLHGREWILILKRLSQEIENKTDGKHPVLIFEDLDKSDVQSLQDMFSQYAFLLSAMPFPVIYTFPDTACYDESYSVIESCFITKTLPGIKTETIDGRPYPKGIQLIRSIVQKRASIELFEPGVLDTLIQYTAGSLRDLFRAVSESAVRAERRGSNRISSEDAWQSLEGLKVSLIKRIEIKDYDFLLHIYYGMKEQVEDRKMMQKMLYASAVSEYDVKRWHNVHPLIVCFFKEQGLITDEKEHRLLSADSGTP